MRFFIMTFLLCDIWSDDRFYRLRLHILQADHRSHYQKPKFIHHSSKPESKVYRWLVLTTIFVN